MSGGHDAKCLRCRAPVPDSGASSGTFWCGECGVGQEARTVASNRAHASRGLRGVLTPGAVFGPFGSRTATVLAVDVWDAWSELRVLEQDPTDAWLDLSDPRDGRIVWDAVDDAGTRHWGFPSTSGGSDIWLITTLSIVPALRTGARWLRLVASYGGVTNEAEIDLTAMRRPRPAAHVATRILPPIDPDRCWQCAAAPAERMGLCRSCGSQAQPTTWGRWEITDDQGRTYTGCNLGSHAASEGWWGEVHLHPGLDPRARRLDVCLVAAGRRVLELGVSLDRPSGSPATRRSS